MTDVALSISAGVRNSADRHRWREVREVSGRLLVDTRSLARQQISPLGVGGPAAASGRLSPQTLWTLEGRVAAMSAVPLADRVEGGPMPRPHPLLLHRTARLFRILLPFGLAASVRLRTPPVVPSPFAGLDALCDEPAEPSGAGRNAVPTDAMKRGTEITMRERPAGSALT